MKLSLEQHNGLGKIARYFEKIELIAENLPANEGILEDSFRRNKMEVHSGLKANQMRISNRRKEVFSQNLDRDSKSSIVNLNVIVNEDRF